MTIAIDFDSCSCCCSSTIHGHCYRVIDDIFILLLYLLVIPSI